jgi:hypothetical protein
MPYGGLTIGACVLHDLVSVSLDHFSRRDPIGRSSLKGCSRPARPPRSSQAAAETKRE